MNDENFLPKVILIIILLGVAAILLRIYSFSQFIGADFKPTVEGLITSGILLLPAFWLQRRGFSTTSVLSGYLIVVWPLGWWGVLDSVAHNGSISETALSSLKFGMEFFFVSWGGYLLWRSMRR